MTAFGVLGPLAAHRDGNAIPLAPSLRRLLAALLSRPNRPVTGAGLIEALWGGRTPANAHKVMQVYIHRLRRILVDDSLISHGTSGYVMRVADGTLDSLTFAALVDRSETAVRQGDPATAEHLLRQALALWRGDPFADTRDSRLVEEEAGRLAEARVRAHEAHGDVLLALGRHAEAVTDLVRLTAAYPLRESARAQAMLALYRCGRRAEALELFRDGRAVLAEQLGVEPAAELQLLHQAMLRGDTTLGREPAAGAEAPWPPVPRELPMDAYGFAGRAAQLATLDGVLGADASSGTRISVITGPVGVGKTMLAVHWAHRVADRFPDGQLYINLRAHHQGKAVASADALSSFLRALGVAADRIPGCPEEASTMFRSLLSGRRMLVVLDNAGTAEQVRYLLPGGPGCHVLITSRHDLGALVAAEGAHAMRLDVLSRPEAAALLTRALDPAQVDREPEAVGQLAEACGYLPLTLRLAAANLSGDPRRSVSGYLAELRDPRRLRVAV